MLALFAAFFFVIAYLILLPLSALIFGWAWNTAAPLYWAAAPHLNFWQALASSVLITTFTGGLRNMISGIEWSTKKD